MRNAIEHQVKAKMAVTADTREYADAATKRLLKQMIRTVAKDPSKAEALGEKLGQTVAAGWVKKHGKAVLGDTVRGARAVLDSI